MLKKFRMPQVSNGLILIAFLFICASYFGMEFSYHGDRITLDIDAEVDEEFYEEQLQGATADAQDDADSTHRAHGIRTMAPGVLGVLVMAFVGGRRKSPKEYLKNISLDEYIVLRQAIDERDAQLYQTQAQATAPSRSAIQPLYSDTNRNT